MSQVIALVDEKAAGVGTPTQVANPIRSTIRTIVQNLIILIPLVNIAAGVLINYLNTQEDLNIPPVVFLVLNGVVAVTAFIIGLVARFMSTPGVNTWITEHLAWLAPIKPLTAATIERAVEASPASASVVTAELLPEDRVTYLAEPPTL